MPAVFQSLMDVRQRLVVGVGDMAVSSTPAATISTYALGSCIGLVFYDTQVRVGGVLHVMLPDSDLAPDKAQTHPFLFVDTGVRRFVDAMRAFGVKRVHLKTLLTGGASVLNSKDFFRIGERNIQAVRTLLGRAQIPISHEQVGGFTNRTVHLQVGSGQISIQSADQTEEYLL